MYVSWGFPGWLSDMKYSTLILLLFVVIIVITSIGISTDRLVLSFSLGFLKPHTQFVFCNFVFLSSKYNKQSGWVVKGRG